MGADADVFSVIGDIGATGATVTFDTMIGPSFGGSPIWMHCQHGVAFCESAADSVPHATHTGFSSITLTAQAGTTWDAGDFALDELNGLADGTVTFVAYDGNDVALPLAPGGSNTFAISDNGQHHYNFVT